ncbi:MAG: hypothetical protein AAFO07_27955 [Bacteroidota bacterium]
MKKQFIVLIISLLSFSLAAQEKLSNGNFFELSIRKGQMQYSDFLEKPPMSAFVNDPLIDIAGIRPERPGNSFSIRLKYGKALNSRLHWLVASAFTNREERAIFFCHVCDYHAEPYVFKEVQSLDFGSGLRYALLDFGKLNLSAEGIIHGSIITNVKESRPYWGTNVNLLLAYRWFGAFQTHLKYGRGYALGYYRLGESNLAAGLQFNF